MKTLLSLLTAIALSLAGTVHSHAITISIDLSPVSGTALNLGAPPTHYFGDHAVGLAAPNEDHLIVSPATGNEVGGGITFDTVTKMLAFDVGWGSDFGFVDLLGGLTDVHFHAPGPVLFPATNAGGPVIFPLGGFVIAGSSPMTGKIMGSVVLGAAEEMALFDNEIYLNVHSTSDPGGEIRGQLIPVPEPSTAMLLLLGGLAIPLRRRRTCAS